MAQANHLYAIAIGSNRRHIRHGRPTGVIAAAIAADGTEAVYLEAKGNIHGFATMRRLVPSAHRDIERLCAALRLLLD